MRVMLATVMASLAVACGSATAQLHAYYSQKCEVKEAVGCFSEAIGEAYQRGMVGLARSTSGMATVVGGMFQGRGLQGTQGGTVWGIATEAWSGQHEELPDHSMTLVGSETSVISQYHANEDRIVGIDVVYKNRRDGLDRPLYGLIGENKYNNKAWGIMISSQPRSVIGEYSGWEAGIKFMPNSLDRSASEKESAVIALDHATVDNNGGNPWMFRWYDPEGIWMGFKYNSKTKAIEFWRDIKGDRPQLAASIDMSGR